MQPYRKFVWLFGIELNSLGCDLSHQSPLCRSVALKAVQIVMIQVSTNCFMLLSMYRRRELLEKKLWHECKAKCLRLGSAPVSTSRI